jgi:hypothetical protein
MTQTLSSQPHPANVPTRFDRDIDVVDTAKVGTHMDATGCLFVLVVLMVAVVTFFWAAGRAQKQAERAQEAAFDAAQATLRKLNADPPNP